MRFLIILILSLIALSLNAQIIKSNAIMELNNMDFSTPCSSCSEWRYSRNTNFLYRWNGTSWIIYNPGSTLNLGLSMPGIFNVSPSTLTGSGTFNVTLNSQAQNTFLAAPSNASGVPSFRTLTPSDLSVAGGLSGTSSAGRVAFYTGTSTLTGDANLTWDNSDKSLSLGGSGVSSSLLTLNSTTRGILIPRMTTTEKNAIVAPATGLLVYDLTLGAFNVYNGSAWVSVGGGLPAGSNGQIQFNNNNVFGASSNLFWDNTNSRLGIGTTAPTARVHIVGTGTTTTSSLTIQNSTPTTILQILDNGRIHQTIPSSANSTIFGTTAGSSNMTGTNNSIFGQSSGQNNTTGAANSLFGAYAGQQNTTGSRNSMFGASAGILLLGSDNCIIGSDAGRNLTSGDGNVIIGQESARYRNDNNTLTSSTSSILIGKDARANANSETNQIVIGQAGRGLGSNTTVLGNSSTVQTWLGGSVTVGTTSIGARLSVAGSGSDNNASSLLIQNSLARTLFSVRNDGLAQLGRNTAVTTQEVAQIEVVSDDTNTGLVITTKGTGAFIVGPAPNGLQSGGNARGQFAIDLQMQRLAAQHVASGTSSVIAGGTGNTASGSSSVVSGGTTNTASGVGATVSGGSGNTASGAHSVVGGYQNQATVAYAAALSGANNLSRTGYGVIAGGASNTISQSIPWGYVAIGGGSSNDVSANFGVIAGGQQSIVSAEYGTITGGARGRAYNYGQRATGSGMFSAIGDSQTSDLRVFRQVTGFSNRMLSLNGTDTTLAFLPVLAAPTGTTSRVWNARIQCVATVVTQGAGTAPAGSSFIQTYDVGIKRIGNTTTLIGGTPIATSATGDNAMSGANFIITADDTNEALKVEFQPPGTVGSDTVIRAIATIYLTELGY